MGNSDWAIERLWVTLFALSWLNGNGNGYMEGKNVLALKVRRMEGLAPDILTMCKD